MSGSMGIAWLPLGTPMCYNPRAGGLAVGCRVLKDRDDKARRLNRETISAVSEADRYCGMLSNNTEHTHIC